MKTENRTMAYIKKLSLKQKMQRRKILKISHEVKMSHLGSCLSAIDIIASIYEVKKRNERFVLSAGHAGVALYVVLEQHGFLNNPSLNDLHVHPDRNLQKGIDVSTGSLGQGLSIAVGIALTHKDRKNVYCLMSDGECTEGSIWEALRVAGEQKLDNLKVAINANGYGAYSKINIDALIPRLKAFGCAVITVNGHNVNTLKKGLQKKIKDKPLVLLAKTTSEQLPFLRGQDAHYKIMTDEDYQIALNQLR